MAQGLQVWDAAGHLIFDTPDRMGRIVNVLTTTKSVAGSVAIPVPAGCAPFWFSSAVQDASAAGMPSITISGNTLSWTAGAVTTIFYGYY